MRSKRNLHCVRWPGDTFDAYRSRINVYIAIAGCHDVESRIPILEVFVNVFESKIERCMWTEMYPMTSLSIVEKIDAFIDGPLRYMSGLIAR